MVGYPMVIVESLWASKSFNKKPEMHVLSSLAKIIPFILAFYLLLKIVDSIYRGSFSYLCNNNVQSNMFIFELFFGVIIPLLMLSFSKVRNNQLLLFIAALMIVLGVVINRINVFIIAYKPPFADYSYFPTIMEVMVTIGFISMLMLLYRILVTIFPVIEADKS
ncbi:MAG: hypothetical protein ABIA04_11300 [Pseudomonadota bacterium]